MFSGIVEEKGSIKKLQTLNEVLSIEINCSEDFVKDISVGDSVSVDGVCLTVTAVTVRHTPSTDTLSPTEMSFTKSSLQFISIERTSFNV